MTPEDRRRARDVFLTATAVSTFFAALLVWLALT